MTELPLVIKRRSNTTLVATFTITFDLDLSHMHSIARYRISSKILFYFIMTHHNRQMEINLLILLLLLLAKTYDGLMQRIISSIFSLIVIVM